MTALPPLAPASLFRPRALLVLAGFLVLCLAVSAIGGLVTYPAIPGWYASLAKPDWTPPNAVFRPVWITLFLMMAVAGWRVSQRAVPGRTMALGLFGLQLVLNIGWSVTFFGMKTLGLASLESVALALGVGATMLAFRAIDRLAGWLFLPYFIWVTYASALTITIWRLN